MCTKKGRNNLCHYNYFFFLGKNRLSSIFITSDIVMVSPLNHSVKVKQMPVFRHSTQNVFVPRNPGKCLLPSLCVIIWIGLLKFYWVI